MAEAIARAPWWVLPGALGALFALFMGVVGLGMKIQKHRGDVVTHAQLRGIMNTCQTTQSANNETIMEGVRELVQERKQIWDIVRKTAETTAVIKTDVGWIKDTVTEMRRESRA